MPSVPVGERQILLLGGTGFLGRRLAHALRNAGFSVAIVARRPGSQPLPEGVRMLPAADFCSPGLDPAALLAPLRGGALQGIINLVSRSSGSAADIRRDNIDSIGGILRTVQAARGYWPQLRFIHLGSIAEGARRPYQTEYGRAKLTVRRAFAASSLCDFHVLLGPASGGNPRMQRDLTCFEPIIARSALMLDGFRLPCLPADEVAQWIARFLGLLAADRAQPSTATIELRLPQRWLTLRELRRECLGRSDGPSLPRPWERQWLWLREQVERQQARRDGSRMRLAFFCRLARLAGTPAQARWNHYEGLRLPALRRDVADAPSPQSAAPTLLVHSARVWSLS